MSRIARISTAVALVATAAAVSLLPATAQADDGCGSGPCVVVHVVGDGAPYSQSFSEDTITANSIKRNGNAWYFGVRNPKGVSGGGASPGAVLPIANLLPLVSMRNGGSLTGVGYVEGPSIAPGRSSILSAADLLPYGQEDNFAGGLVPAVYVDPPGMGYIRPLRAGPPTDVNSDEWVQEAHEIDLTVYLHVAPLSVSLQASTSGVSVGDSVTFQALATRSQGEVTGPVRYFYQCPNQPSTVTPVGTASSVSCPFTSPGDYFVTVFATDGAGVSGRSDGVEVKVTGTTTPPPDGNQPGTGGNPHHHHPQHGPTHSGGHQHSGTPRHHHDPTTQEGGPPHSGGHRPGSGPSTSGPSTPSLGHATHDKQQSHGRKGTLADQGSVGELHGFLLEGARIYQVPQASAGSPPSLVAAHSVPRHPWSLPWEFVAGLVVVALIAGGMAGEGVQLRRRRARMQG